MAAYQGVYISPVCDFLFLIPFPLKNNDLDILFLWRFPRLNKSFNQQLIGLEGDYPIFSPAVMSGQLR